MPRYFFDIINGVEVIEDLEGAELGDLDEAKMEAIEDHLALAVEALRQHKRIPFSRRILIHDHNRCLVAQVSFMEAIAVLQ